MALSVNFYMVLYSHTTIQFDANFNLIFCYNFQEFEWLRCVLHPSAYDSVLKVLLMYSVIHLLNVQFLPAT